MENILYNDEINDEYFEKKINLEDNYYNEIIDNIKS